MKTNDRRIDGVTAKVGSLHPHVAKGGDLQIQGALGHHAAVVTDAGPGLGVLRLL
jgi:hypothetical protein